MNVAGQTLTEIGGSRNGTVPDSAEIYEIAPVAVGTIRESFVSGAHGRVSAWAATHEMAHIIGGGLTDACLEPGEHDFSVDYQCLMSFVCPGDHPLYVDYCCGTNTYDFDVFSMFCPRCKEKLNDPWFLSED